MSLRDVAERFRVTCLIEAEQVAAEWRATHVVSLLDPELDERHVPLILSAHHHVVRLRDQESPTLTGHFPDMVTSLFAKVEPAINQPDARILVHCHAGVSRSTAFTYALIAHRAGPGREAEAFDAFMGIVNKPWPNRRLIEILDAHWGRNGALLAPLDAMRARFPRRIEAWNRFNERRGLFDLYGRYGR